MTTSICSEAFDKKKLESQRMKDNTVNKKIINKVGKRTKLVIEQMTFSDHKKLRNEDKHFIKKSQNLIYFTF